MRWRGDGKRNKTGYDRGLYQGQLFSILFDNSAVTEFRLQGYETSGFIILGRIVGEVFNIMI